MNVLKRIKLKKDDLISVLVFIICTLALYFRLKKLFYHKLWADEYWQINQMKDSFISMIKGFPANEFCSYLSGDFYLIFPFFKVFGENKWGLAIPHIILTLVGFYLLYLLCRRYFKTIWGYGITFSIVCFNETLINHATEIRTYAVLPTLALACLYFWLRLVDCNYCLSRSKKIAVGVFFVLTIWFHAYGILIFFFTGLFALAEKFKDRLFFTILRNTFFFAVFTFCFASPLLLISFFGPHLDSFQFKFDTFQFISNPLQNSIGFLKSVFGSLIGYKKFYFLLLGIAMPFLLPYKNRFEQIALLFVLVLMPIGTILLFNILTHYWFLQRLFIWVMPFFALFIGWTWDSLIVYIKEKFVKRINKNELNLNQKAI